MSSSGRSQDPPKRQVHCTDALQFLASALDLPCVLTSLPDITESQGLAQWSDVNRYKMWFLETCKHVLKRLRPGCAAVIYVTDAQVTSKASGLSNICTHYVDKSFLCSKAALEVGAEMLWHKIALRNPVGAVRLGSPAYTHMLCYMSPGSEWASYDVTASKACPATYAALRWLKETLGATEVCDPFCGEGTALAAANLLGMDAVGVEISPKRCKRARSLILQWQGKQLIPLKHPHEIAAAEAADACRGIVEDTEQEQVQEGCGSAKTAHHK